MTACYKDNLYVQQEWVDRRFLASSKVGTPDPRQEDPPFGQRLIVAWNFPNQMILEGLKMVTTVRLWDNVEEVFEERIDQKRNVIAYFFSKKNKGERGEILTYRVQVLNKEGEEISLWEHHLWTELIDVGHSS